MCCVSISALYEVIFVRKTGMKCNCMIVQGLLMRDVDEACAKTEEGRFWRPSSVALIGCLTILPGESKHIAV